MSNKTLILVIEDDNDISNMIRDLLDQNGYDTKSAYSGTEALMVFNNKINLVLLDLMLPGLSGEIVLKEIRKHSNVPVIGLSAKSDKESTINLLKSGADDYIIKPFNNDELLARIEAQLRRYKHTSNLKNEYNKVTYKDITIDIETHSVQVGETSVSLTKREFLILELLMKYPKKVFTKSNLYEHVWNDEFFGDENTINVHISNIRSKLAKANPLDEYIQTVWGIGFKMSE
ncbi:response regulator transcription factor [Terrisporobacter petrolearius]|uniref:response regulator transcription factor n=1 Tax=Terrisporobacter petrolearius TaxID=1460447 RepID=UPI001D1693CF|nr:response regulator transcription factor [Terrisporobacter petrolearius]MCC3863769.1 response regulator transcription factor [Terrisporobacter petrolearius]